MQSIWSEIRPPKGLWNLFRKGLRNGRVREDFRTRSPLVHCLFVVVVQVAEIRRPQIQLFIGHAMEQLGQGHPELFGNTELQLQLVVFTKRLLKSF